MRVFRDRNESRLEQDIVSFVLGAAGGLAMGLLVSRATSRQPPARSDHPKRSSGAVRRLRPARLRRLAEDQEGLDQLEDAVLRAFNDDQLLGGRGVDIGAISPGIVELSGSVWSEDEAHRAVSLANRVTGVKTVVNRLEIESRTAWPALSRPGDRDLRSTFGHSEGRTGGMGRRRQGFGTEPDRPDDSQIRRLDALVAADRAQYEDEGFAHEHSVLSERPGVQPPRTRFREDELDNQDPHGKHADLTLDSPPQDLNSDARVGEGMKPGTRRSLEGADLPIEGPPERDT
jgi:hypothetical protein